MAEAFYRKDLEEISGTGRIYLVWGDDSYGLKHILDKHEAEFKDIAKEISEIVENGKLEKLPNKKYSIKTPRHTLILGENENNQLVITAYRDSRNKKMENYQTGVGDNFTDEPLRQSSLSANQKEATHMANESIPKIFNQGEVKFNNKREFSDWSEFIGIKFRDEAQKEEAFWHIQKNLKNLEC